MLRRAPSCASAGQPSAKCRSAEGGSEGTSIDARLKKTPFPAVDDDTLGRKTFAKMKERMEVLNIANGAKDFLEDKQED